MESLYHSWKASGQRIAFRYKLNCLRPKGIGVTTIIFYSVFADDRNEKTMFYVADTLIVNPENCDCLHAPDLLQLLGVPPPASS